MDSLALILAAVQEQQLILVQSISQLLEIEGEHLKEAGDQMDISNILLVCPVPRSIWMHVSSQIDFIM